MIHFRHCAAVWSAAVLLVTVAPVSAQPEQTPRAQPHQPDTQAEPGRQDRDARGDRSRRRLGPAMPPAPACRNWNDKPLELIV